MDLMDRQEIRTLVEAAMLRVVDAERALLDRDVSERALTHHLARILAESGIPVDYVAHVSLDDAHAVLYCTAEILSRRTLAQYLMDGRPAKQLPADVQSEVEKLAREAKQLAERRKEVLGRIGREQGERVAGG